MSGKRDRGSALVDVPVLVAWSVMDVNCIQERFAPNNACFGCGAANLKGLRLRSFAAAEPGEDVDPLIATWRPEQHHEAFPGVLAGGIVGTLLDCHCNWTAAWHLMRRSGAESPPCTVTAEYSIKLSRPTPTDGTVELRSRILSATDDRAEVAGTLTAGGRVTATCRGTFVAVKPGHPAYHRW